MTNLVARLRLHPQYRLGLAVLIGVVLLILPLAAESLGAAWVRTLGFAALYVMLCLLYTSPSPRDTR